MAKQLRFDLDGYWVRENGPSLKLSRIASCGELPLSARLLAAILRDDREAAELLFSENSTSLVADLLKLVQAEKLNYLALEKLIESELIDRLNEAERKELNFRASQETILQRNSDKRFEQILDLLSNFNNKIVWIKGTSLSRTVYPRPAQRSTGDFDLVIHPDIVDEVMAELFKQGYGCLDGGAFCNQFGVGPIGTAKDLLLAPHRDWLPTSFMALRKGNSDILDIKVSPFDRGLRLHNPEQFFAGANEHTCRTRKYYAPDVLYHLALTVHNFDKDRFRSWKHLYDIHLLANKISQTPSRWQQFVSLCREESIESSAWASLVLAIDRLHTAIPDSVLEALAPSSPLLSKPTLYTVSTYFVWNATGLPMLLANALCSSDYHCKLAVLAKSFLPSVDFLSRYYNRSKAFNAVTLPLALIAHWLLLIFPGGAVRKTFGRFLWPYQPPGSEYPCVTKPADQQNALASTASLENGI